MGNSIVDYLKEQGQPSDFASRSTLAATKGITGYSGTSGQNIQLLNILRGGGGATQPVQQPVPQPVQPTGQQQAQSVAQPAQAQPAQQTGNEAFGAWLRSHGYNDENVIANAMADPSTAGSAYQDFLRESGGGGTSGGSTPILNQPTINLPDVYDTLFEKSGITALEGKLSAQTKAFNDAQSKINDNPYLSEANRVGRIQKLQTDFNANSQGTRDDIATKRADIETKFNIQSKQFEIDSDQAKTAREYAKYLIESGALANASGEDIASITMSTGLSSSMIRSWIKSVKDSSLQTQIMDFDDGTNQGFVLINSTTGEIINTQNVATSKPKAGGTPSSTKNIQAQFLDEANTITGQQTDEGWIGEFPLLVAKYASFMSLQDIYKMYAQSSLGQKYGAPTESAGEIKEIYDYYRKGE